MHIHTRIMTKQITMRTGQKKIHQLLSDDSVKSVNLKTEKGFMTKAGTIFSKQEGDKHFIAINGRWVLV